MVLGIIAFGMTMVIISGEIDLSVGSAVAFAGCLTAYLTESLAATGRKELVWSRMVAGDRQVFQEVAEKHWTVWLGHGAVQALVVEALRHRHGVFHKPHARPNLCR